MKIHIEVENDEFVTPLMFANELIRMETECRTPSGFKKGVSWLGEVAEYIMVFVNYNRRNNDERNV